MAVLTDQARAKVVAYIMREFVDETWAVTKGQIRNAVNAADQWFEDHRNSLPAIPSDYVTSLPAGFANNSTAKQKNVILACVLWRRVGMLRVAEDV